VIIAIGPQQRLGTSLSTILELIWNQPVSARSPSACHAAWSHRNEPTSRTRSDDFVAAATVELCERMKLRIIPRKIVGKRSLAKMRQPQPPALVR